MQHPPVALIPETPQTAPAPEEVLAQLNRIAASSHFRNSRRCLSLLRHVVTAAVEGSHDALKERVVGAEVFGREPDYDTNHDAVVRNAAAEIRKRLAQYYLEPGHESELRIELPPGSYLPEFHPAPLAPDSPPAAPRRWPSIPVAAALLLLGCLVGFLVSPALRTPPRTELDLFWAPVISTPGEVQVLIGQSRAMSYSGQVPRLPSGEPDPKATVPVAGMLPLRDRFLWLGDSFCLARVNGYLAGRGKTSRFRGAAVTPYAEVRGQPVVLIGAFNNAWTERLTDNLRFSLVNVSQDLRGVRDALHPEPLKWSMTRGVQGWLAEEDFALITRAFEPRTGQVVVSAGGIGHLATMATGDFLSNPALFRQAVASAPQGWDQRNMQFVLRIKVADGTPSPPEILAAHFW